MGEWEEGGGEGEDRQCFPKILLRNGGETTPRVSQGFFWFFVVVGFFFFFIVPISRAGVVTSNSVPETLRISRNVKRSPAP